MPLEAVLFDMGGPLDTEVTHERLMDEAIRAQISVSDADYAAANAWAVASFAPNTYGAIIWRLTGGHDAARARRIWEAVAKHPPHPFELRDGIAELLADLRARGLRLGVVANQPARAVATLEQARIAQFFDHLGISQIAGYHKPDPRLFLAACSAIDVTPRDCVMVGDRIDNDIAPAKLLGMRTVLLRAGRHVDQQPRSWHEVPDFEVRNVSEMRDALLQLLRA